jgi:PAS domain S-box-containing protein
MLRDHGVRSAVCVTIDGPDGLYGVLAAHTSRPRTFTEDDLHFLSSMAAVLGAAMQRRQAREQLATAEARYRTLVERIPAVAYTAGFGSDAKWEYVAPQIEGVLGYTPEAWMADPGLWYERILPEDRAMVMEDEQKTVTSHGHLAVEYRIRAKDDRVVWIRDDAVVVHDDDGKPLFFQGVLYDITDWKEAEAALRKAYDREREAVARLESLDEMKNAFLSAVSHELRTPLAAVLGYALTLEQEDIRLADEERQEVIERLAVNARKLHRLLEDLLDLDRLARGIVEPHRQPVDLGTLARSMAAEVDIGRTLEIDVDSVVADVDGAKVERIVENLLANAAKHTPHDSPVRLVVREEPGGVLLAVEDRGPGVPDDLKESVFGPFVRGPETPAHSPGAGIGLSLVVRFAELHGGRAWVEDRPGGGSSFRVYLPHRVDDRVVEASRSEAGAG